MPSSGAPTTWQSEIQDQPRRQITGSNKTFSTTKFIAKLKRPMPVLASDLAPAGGFGFCHVDAHTDCCNRLRMVVDTVHPHSVMAAGKRARLESHLRTQVAQVAMHNTEQSWSPDEMPRQHLCLTHARIHSALACFNHSEAIEQEIEEGWEEAERVEERTPPAPFLARLKASKRRHASSAVS